MVSSGWLWAARCSALICTIAYGVAFVAAAARDIMGALIFLGRSGSLSLALLYLLFRRGRIHWHLRLVWARQRLSLPCSHSPLLSCTLALQYLFGNARVKQYCRIPEDGARSKGDGETAIGLWRRNMLRTCRLADIHCCLAFTWGGFHM